MSNKHHLFIFAIIIVLVVNLLVLSCGHQETGVQVIALLDFSGSLTDAEFGEYIKMLRLGLVQNLTINDAITLVPIDQAAETKFQVIAHRDMQDFEKEIKSKIGRYKKLKSSEIKRKAFSALKDTLFQAPIQKRRNERKLFRSETDILGAISEALPYWKNADARPRVLFIFSDMVQESPDLNLKKMHSEKEIDPSLTVLKEKKLVPELQNVSVFVCGATSKHISEYRLFRQFWEKYFSNTGAQLYAYGYGNYDRIAEFLEQAKRMGS